MIQSVDSYVYDQVSERLKIILGESYIIDEALKGIDLEARKAFKDAYTGENAREITVSYEFPQVKEDMSARYVITLGGAEELTNSIGGIQGDYFYREDSGEKEIVPIVRDGDRLVFETSKPVGEFFNSPTIEFTPEDHLEVKDGKASFDYETNERLKDKEVEVHYSSLLNNEETKGMYQGFLMSETLGVVGISNNMDVARCLDAILKMILITMRDSQEERTEFMLQKLSFSDMQPLIQDGDLFVFGRPCTLSYQVTHSISFDVRETINEIILRKRVKN